MARAFWRLMLLAWRLMRNCFFADNCRQTAISLLIDCMVAAVGGIETSSTARLLLEIDTGSEKISLKAPICLLPMARCLISLILAFY